MCLRAENNYFNFLLTHLHRAAIKGKFLTTRRWALLFSLLNAVYAHCFPVMYIIRCILCSLFVMPRLVIRMFSSHSKRKRPFILSFWNFFLYRPRPIVVSKLSNWMGGIKGRYYNIWLIRYTVQCLCYLFCAHGRQARFVCLHGYPLRSRVTVYFCLAVRRSWL